MSFRLTILGCGSAIPLPERSHTAQYLKINNTRILIDCGENTQVQLTRFKKKIVKLDFVFISHLHGDHFFGLPGLLSTMSLLGRTEPLHLFGPKGLKEFVVLTQSLSKSPLLFPIVYKELNLQQKEKIHSATDFEVFAFPLNHRIDCYGFQFLEKPKPYKIKKDKLPKAISIADIHTLKEGKDVIEDGEILYKASEMTFPPEPCASYSYCSDTAPFLKLKEYIKGSTYLYHEASFTNFHTEKAKNTFHSTAEQAAELALHSEIQHLIIGHFSARYKNLEELHREAKTIFPNTELAFEGFEVSF